MESSKVNACRREQGKQERERNGRKKVTGGEGREKAVGQKYTGLNKMEASLHAIQCYGQ